ncbi:MULTISPECIES: PAS domain-containing protein [unclassified Flavobacterium]|uniref:PAS domain-containing sensor histidine kinase n=1 Tax=unclassified Flavobacterium TaxID=196869 RepID=UPI001F142948|nr:MULTISPECIES: PAS domain-containing protein [unclassified Flavobacterium]UMY66231.1 PAS domain-containing protein [Flavobacterium sp. HJ-32-4]
MQHRIADARNALYDALASGGNHPLPALANPFGKRPGTEALPEILDFHDTFLKLREAGDVPSYWREIGIRHLITLLDLITLRWNDKGEHHHSDAEFDEIERRIEDLNARYREQADELDRTRARTQRDLEVFFRQAPIGILVLRGPELRVEHANPLYLSLIDKGPDFIGKNFLEALPELKTQSVKDMLFEVYQTGRPHVGYEHGVVLRRHQREEQTYFNFVYQPLREDDGTVTGIIVVCSEVTDIVLAKQVLSEKEREFRNIVTQSPIAIAIFKGPNLVIDLANRTMLETLWRRTDADVIGHPLMDVFPELENQPFPRLLHHVIETGQPLRDREALAVVDGPDGRRSFYVDYDYTPLMTSSGKAEGVICTVNDVTEKVQARKLLESAQVRYSHLIETLPVGMYTIDENGYIDLYNQAAASVWGRHPEPGVDRWCGAYQLYSLDGVPIPHDSCPMALAFRNGQSLEEELYMVRENGERRHVIVYPRMLHDEDGRRIGASKVMIDITERKKAEEALRESEEKFRLLTDTIPQLIWTADALGNIDYYSDSVYQYCGKSPAELARKGWLEIVHPDDRTAYRKRWLHSLQSGEDYTFEHRLRGYDGQYRWYLSRAVPLQNENGQVTQWVGTATDIQDQKDFQQTLEKVVEERTFELKRANMELEGRNKELSSFAYISSHDLQEPLRKIQTFVSIIIKTDHDNLSEAGRRNFERMQVAANRMKTLINDLLTYSRANNGEKVFEPTHLNTILGEITAELSDAVEAKNARILIDDLPVVNGIPFQLRQLFINLVSNALKFTRPEVPPVIRITSESVNGKDLTHEKADPGRRYVHLAVADNGIGFEPEYATKIFEVFQRLHSRGDYEGTGIGLAICNKIVENHEGILYAESQPGEGATFHIYLPLPA